MAPHKSCKFCTILDLSFHLYLKGRILQSVNSPTKKAALTEAMIQLGDCIQHLIALLTDHINPDHPFVFSKLDIKDGFWRMSINDLNTWNFCYVFPSASPTMSLDDIQIVVPSCL